ncbi:MAG: hypothetical protein J5746_05390 [Victivallales bacterium]|nr:hypothetical protein [Victivallales bacterium]
MSDGILHIMSFPEPPLDRREALRYAGTRELPPEQASLFDECVAELLPLLSYKVCWRFFPVGVATASSPSKCDELDLGFAKVSSKSLAANLAGCGKLLLFAATVGIAPDRLVAKYGRISPVKALFCQAIGAERIEALCDMFCKEIASQEGTLRPRFSPGYGDLPLELQSQIFSVLDCNRKIGLSLTSSLLMTPTKSVTALAGIN